MPVYPMRPDKDLIPRAAQFPGRPPPKMPAPISTNSRGQYARPIAPPVETAGPISSIESYLGGDTGYQQQLRDFAQTLSDFNADTTRRRGSLESEYGLSNKALNDQKTKDLSSLEEDYGSRGLLRSGLYGSAVGDYESEFSKRIADLARRQNEALGMLDQESTQFNSRQKAQEQAAREAAIGRRAGRYGV